MTPLSGLISRRTVRVRLALLYAGIFLLLGTAMIAVIVLATRSNPPVVTVTPTPAPGSRLLPPVPRPGPIHLISPVEALVQQHAADTNRLLLVAWVVLALTAIVSIPL